MYFVQSEKEKKSLETLYGNPTSLFNLNTQIWQVSLKNNE